MKDKAFNEWANIVAHSQEVESVDPFGNFWLFNQQAHRLDNYQRPEDADQSCSTRVVINRVAKNNISIICRRSLTNLETLGHILGECTAGNGWGLIDWVVGRIEENMKMQGHVVTRKEEFVIYGERKKPNLAIKTRDLVFIVNVTLSGSTPVMQKIRSSSAHSTAAGPGIG